MRVSGWKRQSPGTDRKKRQAITVLVKRLEKSIGEVCCERRLDLRRAGDGAE